MSFSKSLIADLELKNVNYKTRGYCSNIGDAKKVKKVNDVDIKNWPNVEKQFGKGVPSDYISLEHQVSRVIVDVYEDIPGLESVGITKDKFLEFVLHRDGNVDVFIPYSIGETRESVNSSLRGYLEKLGYNKEKINFGPMLILKI
ncbi:MAG: hypothetical protein NTW30_02675 [Candidatus Aenigmarchaeota archaeon]|nr:hypothetical protein [Candidatus Aenigmarchaeota archaeon]